MSFDAGAIVGSLEFDISPYAQGMLEATSIAHLFPHIVQEFLANPLLGLIGIAEEAAHFIREAFESVAEAAHDLGIEAERAGVSAGFLGKIGAAAKGSKTSIEEVAHSMAFLNRNAAEAAAGNKTAMESFA